MCGIAGYSGNVASKADKLRLLWLLLQERGGDASGAAWYDGKKVWYSKKPGSPVDLLEATPKWWATAEYVMLHCRQATGGTPLENRNNHPIIAHGWAVTHNGIIWNDDEIPAKVRQTACDSEAINWMAKRYGLKDALVKELLGWYTIAAVQLAKPKTVYLYTEGEALYLAREQDGVAWASEGRFLTIAGFRDIKQAEAGVLYKLQSGQMEQENIGLPEMGIPGYSYGTFGATEGAEDVYAQKQDSDPKGNYGVSSA